MYRFNLLDKKCNNILSWIVWVQNVCICTLSLSLFSGYETNEYHLQFVLILAHSTPWLWYNFTETCQSSVLGICVYLMSCICWYNKRKIWSLKFADVPNPDDRWYMSMCFIPVLTDWIKESHKWCTKIQMILSRIFTSSEWQKI